MDDEGAGTSQPRRRTGTAPANGLGQRRGGRGGGRGGSSRGDAKASSSTSSKKRNAPGERGGRGAKARGSSSNDRTSSSHDLSQPGDDGRVEEEGGEASEERKKVGATNRSINNVVEHMMKNVPNLYDILKHVLGLAADNPCDSKIIDVCVILADASKKGIAELDVIKNFDPMDPRKEDIIKILRKACLLSVLKSGLSNEPTRIQRCSHQIPLHVSQRLEGSKLKISVTSGTERAGGAFCTVSGSTAVYKELSVSMHQWIDLLKRHAKAGNHHSLQQVLRVGLEKLQYPIPDVTYQEKIPENDDLDPNSLEKEYEKFINMRNIKSDFEKLREPFDKAEANFKCFLARIKKSTSPGVVKEANEKMEYSICEPALWLQYTVGHVHKCESCFQEWMKSEERTNIEKVLTHILNKLSLFRTTSIPMSGRTRVPAARGMAFFAIKDESNWRSHKIKWKDFIDNALPYIAQYDKKEKKQKKKDAGGDGRKRKREKITGEDETKDDDEEEEDQIDDVYNPDYAQHDHEDFDFDIPQPQLSPVREQTPSPEKQIKKTEKKSNRNAMWTSTSEEDQEEENPSDEDSSDEDEESGDDEEDEEYEDEENPEDEAQADESSVTKSTFINGSGALFVKEETAEGNEDLNEDNYHPTYDINNRAKVPVMISIEKVAKEEDRDVAEISIFENTVSEEDMEQLEHELEHLPLETILKLLSTHQNDIQKTISEGKEMETPKIRMISGGKFWKPRGGRRFTKNTQDSESTPSTSSGAQKRGRENSEKEQEKSQRKISRKK